MEFTLEATSGKARAATIKTAHSTIQTPVFMPVGTLGSIKSLDMDDVLNQLVGLTPIQKHKTSLIAPYNDYKLAEIKSKYAKDFELMERLNGS